MRASTATLALGIALNGFSVEAQSETRKVPLPKQRPISRGALHKNVVLPTPRPTAAAAPGVAASAASRAATLPPAQVIAPVPRPPAGPSTLANSHPRSAVADSGATPRADIAAVANVISLVRQHKIDDATQAMAAISDSVARKLAEWIILRSYDNGVSMERYRAFIQANPSWPSQTFMRRRAEATLWDDNRDDAAVLSWFARETPQSAKGKLVLARAMLARGDRRSAERLVRDAWRNESMTEALEKMALEMFGAMITPADHKARMDWLLYGNDREAALRAAKRLGPGEVALAQARIALDRRSSNGKALLDAVPRELHHDPGYMYSKIQMLRRDEKFAEAARVMEAVTRDPDRLHNLDDWWVERRLLARKLLDVGDPRSAYVIARDAVLPSRDVYQTQQQFTAGWIALRFLHDPATAAKHFAQIREDTDNPTALARAGYWQGRAAEAAGRHQDARAAYARAAAHSTSYYGQLARARLGLPQIALRGPQVRPDRDVGRLEVVRAAQILYALNEDELALPIFADIGDSGDIDALVGLGELAKRQGDARGMLLLGKAALNRGMPFEHYAYPMNGIPQFKSIGPQVEPAIVYAIARQESGFNPNIVSPAKAYGLMQVTEGAGKYVCRKYRARFDAKRLKNDPVYNAALGAAELGGLIEDYGGSYIMTFAAYNAGRGSVRKWIERYGDPRDPKVDAVDWVESIPFSETRNYVQRIMENLQVYRARFGGSTRLQIEADLHRGAQARAQ
nr:lytic transglycosylase domain-containing protein [Rhodopseudomonas palustris]